MSNLTSRQEGLSRIKSLEHDNQHQGRMGGKVPIKTFMSKGQLHNPKKGGGINRSLKPTRQH